MDAREAYVWEWESVIDIFLQNPALIERIDDPEGLLHILAVVPTAIPAPGQNAVGDDVVPAQPAAILAPEAHNGHFEEAVAPAGGDPVSPRLSITTQEARDSHIVLADLVRARDLALVEQEEEAAYGFSSDEEDEDEDHGEDSRSSNLLDKVLDSDLEQFKKSTISGSSSQMQQAEEGTVVFPTCTQELAVAQDQVERPHELVHEADPLNQALVLKPLDLEEDHLVGPETGALESPNFTPHVSPTLSSTTPLQEQAVQPGAVDVSPAAASSITALELPDDDVPAEAAHVDVLGSPTSSETDIVMEADDASSMLREELVARPGIRAHIANADLIVQPIIPAIPVTAEKAVRPGDAAATNGQEAVISTRVVSSLDPIHDEEGTSITSTALQKKQVTSSECSFIANSSPT